MYIPAANRISDTSKINAFIQANGFATLVSQGKDGPWASHLPFVFDEAEGGGLLRCHMARANEQWRHIETQPDVLCIFLGPHAYISPSWYAAKVAVPTWNYAAVHVYGTARVEDDVFLRKVIEDTTTKYESKMPSPWRMPIPEDYIASMMKAIVGFSVQVKKVEAKFKLGRAGQPRTSSACSPGLSNQATSTASPWPGSPGPRAASGRLEFAPFMIAALHRRLRKLRNRYLPMVARRLFRPRTRLALERLGSDYGGWVVPPSLISAGSLCYCVGVGEDITFDLELIRRFGCTVYAFDPTPRSARHAAAQAGSLDRFHFQPLGLWSEDADVKFYAPRNREHVSHSIVNLQATDEFFIGRCRRLSGLMSELGHSHLDLLKLDIEGAEYAVLQSMLADGILPTVLCVEFDQPMPFRMTRAAVRDLRRAGYQVCCIDGWNFTFAQAKAADAAAGNA